ncbi:hypothetical protein MMC08_007349 [Hypocenomyce scalaris]|nr:hypothetical protein [Hypocenomyce scalaris]
MAVLSAMFLSGGVLTHYWDIYKQRTVRGISFVFVGIDAAGDLFSLISVFFEPTLNIPGMAIYACELILWLGVFACGGYFNLGPWIRRRGWREGFGWAGWYIIKPPSQPRDIPALSTNPSGVQEEEGIGSDAGPGEVESGGVQPEAISLHPLPLPSSTSVFHTPSSLLLHRMNTTGSSGSAGS